MKIKLNKGLQISKETLLQLEDSQMINIKGQGSSGPKCTCRRHSCGGVEEEIDL
ncbi:class I lanthipeptide [uncultured Dokdonia sp.]|uniref:class I lanthipeptide n=1 Tax=uncultured Dokdonia sp. TaxID=575653 RepID=UPI00261E148C|nr:class I lanthipeptide [uncultured Dokdonia sp.]